jgi:hypothetical protein
LLTHACRGAGDPATRFAVVIPVSDSEAQEVEREAEKLAGETIAPSRPKKAAKSHWKSWPNTEKLEHR